MHHVKQINANEMINVFSNMFLFLSATRSHCFTVNRVLTAKSTRPVEKKTNTQIIFTDFSATILLDSPVCIVKLYFFIVCDKETVLELF